MRLSQFGFLADENIHIEVVAFLRERGLNVATAEDLRLTGAADSAILNTGRETGRVILTHDRDFGSLAVAAGQSILGIAFLRPGHIQAKFTIGTLRAILENDPEVTPPFILVAARTREKVRIRVRAL